ncbi:MAG: YCF48-related protein [Candidatus Acidiferrales bacterium]
MQDVPKIVLKRLQETAAVGTHPDADLLAAFAERSLGETERARVMEHLARCGDCREVVTVAALPAKEAEAVNISVAPTRGSWFGWPVLRWVAVAAGIVAIATVGIVQYRQREKSEILVSSLTSSNETSATADAIPSPSATPAPVAPQMKESLAPTQQRQAEIRKKALPSRTDNLFADRLVVPANPAMPKAQAMRGMAAGSAPRGALEFTNNGAVVVPKAAPPPSSSDAVAVNGNLQNATPAETAKLAPSLSAGQPSAAPSSAQTIEVESQGEAVTATTDSQVSDQIIENKKQHPSSYQSSTTVGVVAPKDAATATEVARMSLASSRWSIGADGALLRSLDAGKTWLYVNVNSEPPASRSKVTRTEDAYESNKSKAKAQLNMRFRAVAADGSEVWAGGSAAMLYHSSDSGAHWTRVLPASSGATLTGDITSIEFSDAQHGRIVTSAGEVWITADNGHTWHR